MKHSISQGSMIIRLVFTMKKLRLGLRFGNCHKFMWIEPGKVKNLNLGSCDCWTHILAHSCSRTSVPLIRTSELCPSLNVILQ